MGTVSTPTGRYTRGRSISSGSKGFYAFAVSFLLYCLAPQFSFAQWESINLEDPQPGQVSEIQYVRFYDPDGHTPDDFYQIMDSLAGFVKRYPDIVFEIASHTDCRASMRHNDSLSQARADSIRSALIRRGVEPWRLYAKGYGERQLLNDCRCEPGTAIPVSDCTEDQHQQNRRNELRVLRYVDPKPMTGPTDFYSFAPGQVLVLHTFDFYKCFMEFCQVRSMYGDTSYECCFYLSPRVKEFIQILKDHQSLQIEIGCHADCRGSMNHTDSMTLNKAEMIEERLINEGISAERILAVGYGERHLLNHCLCEGGKGPGVDCTEEEHQQNRRIEIKILDRKE